MTKNEEKAGNRQKFETDVLHKIFTFSWNIRSRQSFGKNIRKQSNPYPKKTKAIIMFLSNLLEN